MPTRSESKRFRRLLLNAVIVPLMLMVVIAAVLIGQISHLLNDSAEVERADRLIARISELQSLTLDLETGVRGFLITGDDRFLDPYNHALPLLGKASADLVNSTTDTDVRSSLHDLDVQRGRWLDFARPLIDLRRRGGDFTNVVLGLQGKQLMDGMRDTFRDLIVRQSKRRDELFRDAEHEAHITLAVVAGVAIGGGVVLAFMSRNQFMQITRVYNSALRTAHDLNQSLELRVQERTGELRQRSSELLDANKELEAFSYSISHDLRAPMRHISGFANLLEKSAGAKLSESDRENLSTIRETAALAGRMVDDLLAFSRVGRATLRSVAVDLNQMVRDCQTELSPDSRNRKIEWKIGNLPVVQGDPALLKLVLLNLLGNAIKYTGKRDEAIIEVGSQPEESTPESRVEMVACFVRDNGVGFDMAYSDKLFGVFQRLHRSEEFEGTGIGLANVKRIVNRLGGRVWAEGKLDHGATFFFTVPLARSNPS